MISENALVVYKNKPALIKEKTADKLLIALAGGDTVKVRDKDIEMIHPGPLKNLNGIGEGATVSPDVVVSASNVRETWELLLAEGQELSLKELAELAFGTYSPATAWAAFSLLLDGLYFTGTADAICPRQREQVEADEKKRAEKQQASGERGLFLERLKNRRLELPADNRFMQDVEALAYGKTNKSRTMKDIGRGETPEEAHALLLESGFWTEQINPHPGRYGVSLQSAQCIPAPPPAEDRRDMTHLAAFAIDSPWSHDPDDAISLETENGKQILYVHVADPAASIGMDSPPEKEARDRGATLYVPECSFRMLAEEALPIFALGLNETAPALTFKMTLNDDGGIAETEIFPSTVKVTRLSYHEADTLAEDARLCGLFALAERNLKRRFRAGAVHIELPEVHISLQRGRVTVEPLVQYRSVALVRECMLLAGEGAGIWATQRNVLFPYIEQEIGERLEKIFTGMAGSYQLRRCLRPRILSTKPGRHEGLGLGTYTQVTSPLRRYTDLLAHIQIRAFLRGSGTLQDEALSADEFYARMAAGEAAASAVNQAERASRNHWLMVYLCAQKDSVWDAVALEKKGNRWATLIPTLAMETQVSFRNEIVPNERIRLVLKSVNIPQGEAIFAAES
jgi:exoribonuclease-2